MHALPPLLEPRSTRTGSMTGRYKIYRAAFRQSGIVKLVDIDGLANTGLKLPVLVAAQNSADEGN